MKNGLQEGNSGIREISNMQEPRWESGILDEGYDSGGDEKGTV